ncbi:MAG TPA: hypothetical protein VFV94_07080 [Polyangiaceae bacterium]|nr:hypothetical protein [Polyangiaceae bacterium]
MLTRRTLLSAWGATLAASAIGATSEVVSAGERTRLVVIVAKTSSINDLSLAQLRRVYLGEPVDSGGQRLIPINHGSTVNERLAFDRLVLGMSKEEVARYWIDRRIRGQSGAPKAVDPDDVHQRVVAKLAGAIGYVRSTEVRSEAKIVRIDGKGPDDRGYPLEL